MANYQKLFPSLALIAISACAQHEPINPKVSRVMDYEDCVSSDTCSAEGAISLQETDGIKMGKLQFPNGKCISVSLPKSFFQKNTLPKTMRVEGKIYKGHHDPSFLLLKINGREISYSPCGEIYLFVK